MKKERFQNKVATSSITLPVATVMATLLWLSHGIYSYRLLAGWLLCGLTTYLIIEINNTNALIRIRTRLTSSMYLVGTGAMLFLHPFQAGSVAAVCLAISYYLLCRTYQQNQPIGLSFHAFLTLGIGSLWFPQLLFLAPFYYGYMAVFLRCISFRVFWAGLIGLALPYWFWTGVSVYSGDFAPLAEHAREWLCLAPVTATGFLQLNAPQMAAWVLTTLIGIISIAHYLHTDYSDKIRVRMLFYMFICQEFLLEAFLLLQPQHTGTLLHLLHLNTCFLASHYFALTCSRLSNILFIITLLSYAALAAFCWYGHVY